MARKRYVRVYPSLEPLETRVELTTMTPANVIGTATGVVSRPHQVSTTSAAVEQRNITPRKHATILGLFVQPTPGSSLQPGVVGSRSPSGISLPVKHGRAFLAGVHGQTVAFTKVNQPGLLATEVNGRAHSTGGYSAQTTLVGDVNGDGAVDLADLQAFTQSYMSKRGQPAYEEAADFNRNGFVNLDDAKALMKNVAAVVPWRPLDVTLHLSPQDQVHYSGPQNSGGQTFRKQVTILGRTTPGSLVIEDTQSSRLPGGTQIYKFSGPAHVADANGYFSIQTTNKEGLNNNDFLILDPFGQSLIRDFPIVWVTYASGRGEPG